MMRTTRAASGLVLGIGTLILATQGARAEGAINGIVLGTPVAAVVQTIGLPGSVLSADSGNRFAFPEATAYADEDGVVRAIDTSTGIIRVDFEGKIKAFPIGTYSYAQAEAELANEAEFSTETTRTYVIGPGRELVLIFDASKKLARVVYGERGAVSRLGVIPGEDGTKTVPYKAPKERRAAFPDGTGTRTTIVRVRIDRLGFVNDVAVLVPSNDVAFDDRARKQLLSDRFTPATLGGRAIGSTIFRELRH